MIYTNIVIVDILSMDGKHICHRDECMCIVCFMSSWTDTTAFPHALLSIPLMQGLVWQRMTIAHVSWADKTAYPKVQHFLKLF